MRDAAARDLRDVDEAVDAAEVDERAEVGERADAARAGRRPSDDLLARLGGLRVLLLPEERGARDDDAPAVLGVLEDPEVERLADEGREGRLVVPADVDLRDRAEGAEAVTRRRSATSKPPLFRADDLPRDGDLRLGGGPQLGLRPLARPRACARGARRARP